MAYEPKWTEDNIGDQSDKTVLITGANSGIGFEAARALAEHGAHVVLGCRNPLKAADAQEAIDTASGGTASTEILLMDLADLDSVREAASSFVASHDRLDVLVNNAGLMATPEQRTAQGFEMQLGVNHLAPFALTDALLAPLLATEKSRVVAISSMGHRPGRIRFDDLMFDDGYSPWPAYFQSKLANLLFSRELQRRLAAADASTIAVSAHPGSSKTNLGHENPGGLLGNVMSTFRSVFDRIATQSAAMGALPTLRAAVDPTVVGGDYYGPSGIGEQQGPPVRVSMTNRARSDAAAKRLWEASAELTGATYAALS